MLFGTHLKVPLKGHGRGRALANSISESCGSMAEEAMQVFLVGCGRVQEEPGMIMRCDRKWP